MLSRKQYHSRYRSHVRSHWHIKNLRNSIKYSRENNPSYQYLLKQNNELTIKVDKLVHDMNKMQKEITWQENLNINYSKVCNNQEKTISKLKTIARRAHRKLSKHQIKNKIFNVKIGGKNWLK